ncbi:peroxiredoxin-like family protein [Hwanghaeella grinnelliae]|nr:peroxiredoxin-like family protein [Hwanghaeella grinnelliae]
MSGLEDLLGLDAPLEEKLRAYESRQRAAGSKTAALYDAFIARLDAGEAADTAPKRGDFLPPFALPNADGELVSSGALLRDGPLVVSFNRGTWCSYCLLELSALGEAYSEIRAQNASIVSVMPDRAARTKSIQEAFNLPFQILTDIDNGYALTSGLMISLGPELREQMTAAGIDLEERQGNDAGFVPIPATYIVAQDGRIVGGGADIDFRRRFPVASILDALRMLNESMGA